MFHPWRWLRDQLSHVDVSWVDLPGDLRATTDGQSRILMDKGLLQVERRCAIAHEAAHIELGHVHGASRVDERAARLLSARRLVDIEDLLSALKWAQTLEEVADELWVTPEVLQDRMESLTLFETAQIVALYWELERAC